MRYRVPQQAFADRRLQGNDLRVLLAIASHANAEGGCWPAQGTIAERLEMHRPHVNRAVRRLEGFGYLVRAGRSGYRSCRYFLTVPTAEAADGTQSCTTGGTQTSSENLPPPSPPPVEPGGDIAASAGADSIAARRPRAARKSGAGRAAGTPPPSPRPSDRGGGARPRLVPADLAGATVALARQAGGGVRVKSEPRAPPVSPVLEASRILKRATWTKLCRLAAELNDEAEACTRFGLTPEGKRP